MDGENPVGMFTERDYARNVFLKGESSPGTPVRDVIAKPVIFARPEHTVDEYMSLTTRKRARLAENHGKPSLGSKLIQFVSFGLSGNAARLGIWPKDMSNIFEATMTTSRGIPAKSLSGRGSFFAGHRCKNLVMGGITAAFAPGPAKKWLPRKP